jgi:hypothetical protein
MSGYTIRTSSDRSSHYANHAREQLLILACSDESRRHISSQDGFLPLLFAILELDPSLEVSAGRLIRYAISK